MGPDLESGTVPAQSCFTPLSLTGTSSPGNLCCSPFFLADSWDLSRGRRQERGWIGKKLHLSTSAH